jgi:hypothetical protein
VSLTESGASLGTPVTPIAAFLTGALSSRVRTPARKEHFGNALWLESDFKIGLERLPNLGFRTNVYNRSHF